MNRNTKIFIGVVLILLLAIIYIFTPAQEYVSATAIENLVNSTEPYGSIVFALFYFITTLLFISAAALSILAGTLFGNFWGSVIVIVSATAAAQTAFLLARYFGSNIVPALGKNGGVITAMVNKVEAGVQANSFRYFFIARCLFLPYTPVSYAAGLVPKANAWQFFWATFITNLLFSPAFVYLGDSLLKDSRSLLLPIMLISFVLLIPALVKKVYKSNTTVE